MPMTSSPFKSMTRMTACIELSLVVIDNEESETEQDITWWTVMSSPPWLQLWHVDVGDGAGDPNLTLTKWWRSRFTLERSTARQGLGPGDTHLDCDGWNCWHHGHWGHGIFGECPEQMLIKLKMLGGVPRDLKKLAVCWWVLYQRWLNWRRNMRSSTIRPIETQQLPGIKRFLSPLNESHNWVCFLYLYIYNVF